MLARAMRLPQISHSSAGGYRLCFVFFGGKCFRQSYLVDALAICRNFEIVCSGVNYSDGFGAIFAVPASMPWLISCARCGFKLRLVTSSYE